MSLTKARELREARAVLVEQARDITKQADGNLSSEDETRFDGLMGEVDALKKDIDAIETRESRLSAHEDEIGERKERFVKQEEITGEPADQIEERKASYKKAFRNYVAYGMAELSGEDRQILREGQVDHGEERALATQTKGTTTTGGFTVPEEMEAQVVKALLTFGGMRQVAKTFPTATGRDLKVPASDDTGNVAKLVAEATAITASTAVPFTQKTLEASLWHTGPIKLSMELEQDSIIDFDAFVADAMQTRLGRAWNTAFTTRSSTETSGPHGIVNDSTGAIDVATLAGLTVDNLLEMQNAIDPAYWGNATWMFNSATMTGIRKLTGSSGNLVWQPGLTAGAPDLLLGRPWQLNQQVASFGTSGNKPIWYGDFSHYWIRDVAGMSIKRLEERYAEEGVTALLGYARVDGRAVFGSTVVTLKPYRCIIQAT